MQNLTLKSLVVCSVLMLGAAASAQQVAPTPPLPTTTPYGPPITLEQAKKVADAAMAEASKRNMQMAIAIVEPSGESRLFPENGRHSICFHSNRPRQGEIGGSVPSFEQGLPRPGC